MTIAKIAAQMGVTPETLVQEVCKQQTEMTMLAVVCGVAFAVIAIIFMVIAFTYEPIFAALFVFPCMLAIMLLSNGIPDYNAWKTAPETTANQYIVEHYGGIQND
jgi:hypothetical protein